MRAAAQRLAGLLVRKMDRVSGLSVLLGSGVAASAAMPAQGSTSEVPNPSRLQACMNRLASRYRNSAGANFLAGFDVAQDKPATLHPGPSAGQRRPSWSWLPSGTDPHPPRYTLVLCHGLGFFEKLPDVFPSLQLSHWGDIADSLIRMGCKVITVQVPSTGAIAERANVLHRELERRLERNTRVNFLAHSMGGLDCRHLITHIRPESYKPVSLTTLSCPHRGSPFMDWCRDYLGLGRISTSASTVDRASVEASGGTARQERQDAAIDQLKREADSTSVSSSPISSAILTHTMLARTIDCPAYANLTTRYLKHVFNPATPDMPDVSYFSFGAKVPDPLAAPASGHQAMPVWHPLWLPHRIVTAAEGRDNDGLVSVSSARWGEYVGDIECDHWQLRGKTLVAPKLAELRAPDLYCGIATWLYHRGF